MNSSPNPNPQSHRPYRPPQLPPPTVLPLRYCRHDAGAVHDGHVHGGGDGNDDDHSVHEKDADHRVPEEDCLLALLASNPNRSSDPVDGGGNKKNKEHYILASADPPPPPSPPSHHGHKRKRNAEQEEVAARQSVVNMLRRRARMIPGVPIIYVKRSVMVLEPMSSASEMVRDGFEKSKFRAAGVVEGGKRDVRKGEGSRSGGRTDVKVKKAKGPNPLSVKKPKKNPAAEESLRRKEKKEKEKARGENQAEASVEATQAAADAEEGEAPKKRRRRHKRGAPTGAEASAKTEMTMMQE